MFVRRHSSRLALIVAIRSTNCLPTSSTYRLNRATGIVRRQFNCKLPSMKDEADMQISSITESKSISSQQLFGRFIISPDQIFYRSNHSFAMVNLRPIVPGHVLVCSTRVIPLLSELNDDEYDDLWKSVRFVQRVLKVKYNCDAFNVAVQDGTHAGQSVPHVHVHVLPRHRGDLERNDDIYDELEAWAPRDEKKSINIPKFDVPEDSERRDRTIQEMAAESAMYKSLM